MGELGSESANRLCHLAASSQDRAPPPHFSIDPSRAGAKSAYFIDEPLRLHTLRTVRPDPLHPTPLRRLRRGTQPPPLTSNRTPAATSRPNRPRFRPLLMQRTVGPKKIVRDSRLLCRPGSSPVSGLLGFEPLHDGDAMPPLRPPAADVLDCGREFDDRLRLAAVRQRRRERRERLDQLRARSLRLRCQQLLEE